MHFDLYPTSFTPARGSGRLATFPSSASNDSLDSRHSMPSFTSFSPAARFAGSPVQQTLSSSTSPSQTTSMTSFGRAGHVPASHNRQHRNSRDLHGVSSSQFPEVEEGSYIDLQNQTHPQHHHHHTHHHHHPRRMVADAGDYVDMNNATYSSPQYSTGTGGTWSSETTTSGSYTVGSQELAQDIDKLFFDPPNDVVV